MSVPLLRANWASFVIASHSSKMTSLNLLLQCSRVGLAKQARTVFVWHICMQYSENTVLCHMWCNRAGGQHYQHQHEFVPDGLRGKAELVYCKSARCPAPEDSTRAGKVNHLLSHNFNASII